MSSLVIGVVLAAIAVVGYLTYKKSKRVRPPVDPNAPPVPQQPDNPFEGDGLVRDGWSGEVLDPQPPKPEI